MTGKDIEDIENLLENHGCILVNVISDSKVSWATKDGFLKINNIDTLKNMSEDNWKYYITTR